MGNLQPLTRLTFVEKAKHLHEAFPDEIAEFISFTKCLINNILTAPNQIDGYFADLLHTTSFWLELVNHSKTFVVEYKEKLEGDSVFFSNHLFDGQHSIFGCYCLHQFIIQRECLNEKFIETVKDDFFLFI